MVVIQSGEDGRYELTLPGSHVPSVRSRAFVARVQTHLAEVFGAPVPACPVYAHTLVCRADTNGISWVCPECEWCSPLGEYEERSWPPSDLSGGQIASAVATRLSRRGFSGVRRISAYPGDDGWVVLIGVWPVSDARTAQLREASRAVRRVEVRAEPGRWTAA